MADGNLQPVPIELRLVPVVGGSHTSLVVESMQMFDVAAREEVETDVEELPPESSVA